MREDNHFWLVYVVSESHNHPGMTQQEVNLLPQSWFLPESVRDALIRLNNLGKLKTSQIGAVIDTIKLYPHEKAWTVKDLQNALLPHRPGKDEAAHLVRSLREKEKLSPPWGFDFELDDQSRLNQAFWMSPEGLENYVCFSDVIELDSTYKTNRFRMPLFLVTGVDNHGITFLICGAIVSNELQESVEWVLGQLKKFFNVQPDIIFTDADSAIERALQTVFPRSRHFLCRSHIAQSMQKTKGLNAEEIIELVSEFWRIGCLASIQEFEEQLNEMTKWFEKIDTFFVLGKKEEKMGLCIYASCF